MAKRSRARGTSKLTLYSRPSYPARDPSVIANPPSLRRISRPIIKLTPARFSPHPVEDLRTWHPERFNRPALKFSGNPASVVIGRTRSVGRKTGWPSHAVRFQDPNQVLTCVRRKTRREVLLALGRGGKNHARPKFSWRSKIHCKG